MDRRDFVLTAFWGGAAAFAVPAAGADQDDMDWPAVPAPKYAEVLFDGTSLSGWLSRKTGGPAEWKLVDGAVEVIPGAGDIYTRRAFTDFQLHVEFRLPYMPEADGQARANSGVYLHGLYEVQVLDSYGLQPRNNDCGAIYETAPPLRNACRKPERWQGYDIAFRAPRFDAEGRIAEKGRVTVFQNGILIHHAQEVSRPTRASMSLDPTKPGPIMLQDHGNPVRYRNVWIIPAA